MYIRKSKGPKTDPCGTPHEIPEVLDSKLLIVQIAYGLLNTIQAICLLIRVFRNDIKG